MHGEIELRRLQVRGWHWAARGKHWAARGKHWAALGFGLAASVAACAPDDAPCEPGQECDRAREVMVAAWWATRGEYQPFEILKQSLLDKTGLGASLAHQYQNKDDHTRWVEKQLDPTNLRPEPLDVFAANAGDEVMRWTPCSSFDPGPPKALRLHAINDPALGDTAIPLDWIESHIHPELVQVVKCDRDQKVYALPVGVHRVNTLFFNKQLLAEAGYAVDGPPGKPLPSSLPELLDAAAALSSYLPSPTPGSSAIPPSVFSVAGRNDWTLSLFFIENVMLAAAQSAQSYDDFWSGKGCDEALVTDTLKQLRSLESYFGSWDMTQDEAFKRVQSGQAAFFVMGDWAAAEVDPNEVGTAPFPGTNDDYVFETDVFALPAITSSDPEKGLAFLRSVIDKDTQVEFSLAKHSLSPRSDLPAPEAKLHWVRALPGYLPYAKGAFSELAKRLQDWLMRPEEEHSNADAAFLDYVRQEYETLTRGTVHCNGAPPAMGSAPSAPSAPQPCTPAKQCPR